MSDMEVSYCSRRKFQRKSTNAINFYDLPARATSANAIKMDFIILLVFLLVFEKFCELLF